MRDLEAVLQGNRSAVAEMVAAAEAAGSTWAVSPQPGKWSPSQVVEHVARALEESANVVAGRPSRFPTFPVFIRPLVRNLFFKRILKKSAFPKARTTRAMDPAAGPATPADGRVRLESAVSQFERDCRLRSESGLHVDSGLFGAVSVEDFAAFQELHTRHHTRQIRPVP